MSSVTATTLSVSFSEAEARSERIVLQQMTTSFDGRGALWGRTFCNQTVTYTSTTGIVERGNRYPQKINSEGISFSNSNSATLKLPGAYEVTILRQILMRRVTVGGITTIEPVDTALVYDAETESVVTQDGLPVYGKASVSYTALYEQFFYRPYVQAIPWGGVTIGLGTVFAYTDSTVETLDMELDFSSAKDWVEYARVTSKIVLDSQGVWEFPYNWEEIYKRNRSKTGDEREEYQEPGYFYIHNTVEIDPNNCFVDTRVHLIIEVNTIGSLRYVDQGNDSLFSPYFGVVDRYAPWTPNFTLSFSSPPSGAKASSPEDFKYDLNHRTWRDVFLNVNKISIIERVLNEYGSNLEIENNE